MQILSSIYKYRIEENQCWLCAAEAAPPHPSLRLLLVLRLLALKIYVAAVYLAASIVRDIS